MPKNPFVNCKRRKRKTSKVVVPKVIPKVEPGVLTYCPRSMVKYQNVPEFGTVWVCKTCRTCLLSGHLVVGHVAECKREYNMKRDALMAARAAERRSLNESNTLRYVCKYCDQVFSRLVTMTKHLEVHEKAAADSDSDDEPKAFKFKRPRKTKVKVKTEPIEYIVC